MPKETLKTSVDELRDQLGDDNSVDEENKEALEELAYRVNDQR